MGSSSKPVPCYEPACQPNALELYVLAQSAGRVDKERAIRRKQLRRLHELPRQLPERDKLLMALGAAKKEAGRFYPKTSSWTATKGRKEHRAIA